MKKGINFSSAGCLVSAAFMITALIGCSGARDGNTMKSVNIHQQEWMVENLNLDHFRNGDPIPEARTDEQWVQAGKEGCTSWLRWHPTYSRQNESEVRRPWPYLDPYTYKGTAPVLVAPGGTKAAYPARAYGLGLRGPLLYPSRH